MKNLAEIIQCQLSVLTCDEVKVENNVIMSNISANSKICHNGIPIVMELTEVELASLDSDVFTDIAVGLVQWASRQAATCDAQHTLSRCNHLRKIFQCGPKQWIYSTQYGEIQNHLIHILKMISAPHNPDTTAQLAALGYGLVFKKRRLERRNYETVLNNCEFVQQLLCHKPTFRPLTTVLTDDIRCVINNTTVTEEHNGGVMCITFLHETDETCIVAPHRLRIKDVYNVWFSFDGFETAIRHGQRHSDGFIVGLQDVRVTGVMPVNFDDQQWEDLGSRYLRLAAEAAVAGNMAAFTDLQAQILPILV